MKKLLFILTLFVSLAASAQYKSVVIPQNQYPENDDVLQRKNNKWVPRSIAELKIDLDILDSSTVADALGERMLYIDTTGMLQAYRSSDSLLTIRVDSIVGALGSVGSSFDFYFAVQPDR